MLINYELGPIENENQGQFQRNIFDLVPTFDTGTCLPVNNCLTTEIIIVFYRVH